MQKRNQLTAEIATNAPITNTLAAKDLQTRTPMSETPSTTEQPSAEPTAKPAPSAPPASATATDEHPSNGTTARAPDKNTTGQSTKPPTIAVENSDDDDDDNNKKEDIYTAIDLQSDRARKDGFTGGSFFLDVDPFADLTITDLTEDIPESVPEAPGSARETGKTTTTNKNAKKLKIQWIRMNLIEVSDGMRHYSVNPLDFMTTAQVRECFKAAQGQSHKLGKLKKILVEAGWKMLVRAVHEGADPKRRAAFIKHGVRSALEVAGSPLNGAITCYSFTKEKYDWHLIVLTKEAFEALENIRSLLDPRTGVLLLFRPYSPQPYQSQTFTYEGIIDDDDTEEMKAKAIEDFRTLADAHYKANNFPLSVGKIEPTPTKRSPNQMSVEFVFDDPRRASILRPEMLPQAYHSWSGKRKLNVYWPSKCRACGSESHRGPMKECPWLSYEAHGVTVSRSAARMYFPGQTASAPPKRKRQDPEEDELLDMRPEGPKAKKQKTTESEPTEKESKGKEKEKQIEDVQMADN